MKYIHLIIFILVGTNIQAQINDTINQEVSPKKGINQLAIEFLGIEFTKDQRALIEGREIEFIFHVEKDGKPELKEINGVTDSLVIHLLQKKAKELDYFNPRIVKGDARASIFFMKLEYPKYQMTAKKLGRIKAGLYNESKLEDFEYLEKSKKRYDLLIGGVTNQFIGSISKYLGVGGGMKIDLSYTNEKSNFFGLNMSFYGNKLKKDYPLNTTKEQLAAPPTLLIGLVAGKWINRINIQGELNIAVQNITQKIGDNDQDWIQLNGWSPGLILNYPIKFGGEKTTYYYGAPSLINNHINLHFGIRYLDLSIKEASGIMTEIGISYRLGVIGIREYKLKTK